jgi:hypothetical protein
MGGWRRPPSATVSWYDDGSGEIDYRKSSGILRRLILVNGAGILVVLLLVATLLAVNDLRSHGVRTVGTSVRVSSSTDSETGQKDWATDVRWVDDQGNSHVSTIDEYHAVGEDTPLVYRSYPEGSVVFSTSDVDMPWIAIVTTLIVVTAGVVVAVDWRIARWCTEPGSGLRQRQLA